MLAAANVEVASGAATVSMSTSPVNQAAGPFWVSMLERVICMSLLLERQAVWPPSTTIGCPTVNAASSEHSHSTAAAISSGRPMRPTGSWAMTAARPWGSCRSAGMLPGPALEPPCREETATAGAARLPRPHRDTNRQSTPSFAPRGFALCTADGTFRAVLSSASSTGSCVLRRLESGRARRAGQEVVEPLVARRDRAGPEEPPNRRCGLPSPRRDRDWPDGGRGIVCRAPGRGCGAGAAYRFRLGRFAVAGCVRRAARARARGRSRRDPGRRWTLVAMCWSPHSCSSAGFRACWGRRVRLASGRGSPAVALGISRVEARGGHGDPRRRRPGARPLGAHAGRLACAARDDRRHRARRRASRPRPSARSRWARRRRDRAARFRLGGRRAADRARARRDGRARRRRDDLAPRRGSRSAPRNTSGRTPRAAAQGTGARPRRAGHSAPRPALAAARLPRPASQRAGRPAGAGRARGARHRSWPRRPASGCPRSSPPRSARTGTR